MLFICNVKQKIILFLFVFMLMTTSTLIFTSCEDDVEVSPVNNADTTCTGSYCRLDQNNSPIVELVYFKNPKAY